MTTSSTSDPLKYIAEALVQMATTLRDFEMQESAQLLDKAKMNIDQVVNERPPRGKTTQAVRR